MGTLNRHLFVWCVATPKGTLKAILKRTFKARTIKGALQAKTLRFKESPETNRRKSLNPKPQTLNPKPQTPNPKPLKEPLKESPQIPKP